MYNFTITASGKSCNWPWSVWKLLESPHIDLELVSAPYLYLYRARAPYSEPGALAPQTATSDQYQDFVVIESACGRSYAPVTSVRPLVVIQDPL